MVVTTHQGKGVDHRPTRVRNDAVTTAPVRAGAGADHRHRDGGAGRTRPAGHRLPGQLVGLLEHLAFQPTKFRARLDPQVLDQSVSDPAVGGQGIGLAAAAVQRGHQLRPQPLSQGMLRHEAFQLGDQGCVACQGKVGVDPQLEGLHPPCHEPL